MGLLLRTFGIDGVNQRESRVEPSLEVLQHLKKDKSAKEALLLSYAVNPKLPKRKV